VLLIDAVGDNKSKKEKGTNQQTGEKKKKMWVRFFVLFS